MTKDFGTITSGIDGEVRPSVVHLAALVFELRHDIADAQCASKLMSEAYDRMVLKYEKRISELEHQLRPFD